jgi:BirA family biotin operon repressor/biotin-[acetyl-CoA-carboxylase] ligase
MTNSQQMLETLDADKIRSAIDPNQQPWLTTLDVFDVINSTNTYLLECAKSGGYTGWVCFAEQQSKGRGRQGRTWHSPKGANIYCSLLWHFPQYQSDIASLSIAVAVMTVRALKKYGVNSIELKWPNDVLSRGRKLAGILLESLPVQENHIPLVVGIGLNLQLPTEGLPPEASTWTDVYSLTGWPVERNRLAGLLLNELLIGLPLFQQQSLNPFLDDWRQWDALYGHEVVVHTALGSIQGTSKGIDDHGELLLATTTGEQKFKCGEVSVRDLQKP